MLLAVGGGSEKTCKNGRALRQDRRDPWDYTDHRARTNWTVCPLASS